MSNSTGAKPSLLLHICCIGCGVYVVSELNRSYLVTLFFYNPNIYPLTEYNKRLNETIRVAKKFSLPLLAGEYDHKRWRKIISGFEQEPERGKRCYFCYQERLEQTARLAKSQNFLNFGTTLSMSPHKDAKIINAIGHNLAEQFGLIFLERDFKKADGIRKSVSLARGLNLYRQNYCGCEFSFRTPVEKIRKKVL